LWNQLFKVVSYYNYDCLKTNASTLFYYQKEYDLYSITCQSKWDYLSTEIVYYT